MECQDRACRDGIYKDMDKMSRELKGCLHHKADKLPVTAKLGLTSIIVTALLFCGGTPLFYSISAAKDKQRQISRNHEQIQTYSVKQDMIIYNQQEFKQDIKDLNTKREQDQQELNKKLESIIKSLEKHKNMIENGIEKKEP